MSDHHDPAAGNDRPRDDLDASAAAAGSGAEPVAPKDLDADIELVSAHLDGESDPSVERDVVLQALRDELDTARQAVATEPPAAAPAQRERNLAAAMAAFDELHDAPAAPTVLPTIGPDAPVVDQLAAKRADRLRTLVPLGAVAAALVLLVAFVAGAGVLDSEQDDSTASRDSDAAQTFDRTTTSDNGFAESAEADDAGADEMALDSAMSDEMPTDDSDAGGATIQGDDDPASQPVSPSGGQGDRPRFDRVNDLTDYARAESADPNRDEASAASRTTAACPDTISTYSDAPVEIVRQVVYLDVDVDLVVYDEPDALRMVAFNADCDVMVDRTL